MEQMKKYELIKDDTVKATNYNYVISKDNPNELVKIGNVDDIDGERVLSYEVNLYRIRALRDFGDVKKGDLGGYVQSEENLSHEGNAWIYDNAKAYENSKVHGNAQIRDKAEVYLNAEVYGNAVVSFEATVSDDAKVYEKAKVGGGAHVECEAEVYGNAEVTNGVCISGSAKIYGYAVISDEASVYDFAEVYGNAYVSECAFVGGHAKIYGHATVYGYADVQGNAEVYGEAQVFDHASLYGNVRLHGIGVASGGATLAVDAEVTNLLDCVYFRNNWSHKDLKDPHDDSLFSNGNFMEEYVTYTHSNQKWLLGTFYGTGEELIEEAYEEDQRTGDLIKAHVDFVKTLHSLEGKYAKKETKK